MLSNRNYSENRCVPKIAYMYIIYVKRYNINMSLENMKNNIVNKFDKNLETTSVELGDKLGNILSHPAISTNELAGIREHLASVFNIVNNELPENPEKLSLVQEKLMRVGEGYDVSGPEFEGFRRELAFIINYSQHNME